MATENPHDEVLVLDGLHPGDDGEVSAVSAGANQHADIVLLKSRRSANPAARDSLSTSDEPNARTQEAQVANNQQAGGKAQELLVKFDPAQQAEIEGYVKSQVEAATKAIAEQVKKLETENKAMKAEADKAGELEAFAGKLPEAMRAAFLAMTPEEQDAYMAQHAQMAAAGAPNPMAKFADELQTQTKKAAELENQLSKMRDEQDQASAVQKFQKLGKLVKVDEFARRFRKVAKVDPETADYFAEQITGLVAKVEAGKLFSVIGADGDPPSQTPMEKIEAAAVKFMEQNPGTTKAAAMAAVLKADKSLYKSYRAERKAS